MYRVRHLLRPVKDSDCYICQFGSIKHFEENMHRLIGNFILRKINILGDVHEKFSVFKIRYDPEGFDCYIWYLDGIGLGNFWRKKVNGKFCFAINTTQTRKLNF